MTSSRITTSIYIGARFRVNRIIATRFPEITHISQEGTTVDSVVFADDNLFPLSLTQADQIDPLLAAYHRYTGISGLNINVRKSTILCINCSPSLTQALQDKGFSTPTTIRHLGLELSTDIQSMIKETLSKIDLKATKRRIMATTPPTDPLHRATLINPAITPLCNHELMALPATEQDLQPLTKEILSFL
jgi:hypothetical protein